MNSSPAQVIEESRELYGVGVDLGEDRGTHDFQMRRLAEIKAMIEQEAFGTIAHAKLVDRYNCLLYIVLIRLEHDQDILPAHARLSDELLLLSYLGFEQRLNAEGYYTLEKEWKYCDKVAVIDTMPETFWDRFRSTKMISYRLVESFKGVVPPSGKIERQRPWRSAFLPDSRYLVRWSNPTIFPGEAWKFVAKSDAALVETGEGKRFWPFEVAEETEWTTMVRWLDLREWLTRQRAQDEMS